MISSIMIAICEPGIWAGLMMRAISGLLVGAKDLIIRGGHNIDPAEIEEALAGHEAVAFVGAIGQPDKHSGELPLCLCRVGCWSPVSDMDALRSYCKRHIHERGRCAKICGSLA